ncbi:hypothetical protein RUND412_010988 [Rhizina undulata]
MALVESDEVDLTSEFGVLLKSTEYIPQGPPRALEYLVKFPVSNLRVHLVWISQWQDRRESRGWLQKPLTCPTQLAQQAGSLFRHKVA